MLALIDSDLCLYRIGFTTENEELSIAKWRMDDMLNRIILDLHADEFKLYLSDRKENNFRYQIYPEYKANRVQPKPKWIEELRLHLIKEWNAEIALGQEADDALGIATWNRINEFGLQDANCYVCSIDKDLLQIPGYHWNFVTGEETFVTPDDGERFFYEQLMSGDSVDNIKGISGIGKKRAKNWLAKELDQKKLLSRVIEAYRMWLEKEWITADTPEWTPFMEKQMKNVIRVTGQVIKIRTKEGELWNSSELEQELPQ